MIESPHIFPSVAPIWAQDAGPEDPEASPATGPPRRFRAQPRAERPGILRKRPTLFGIGALGK